jgi:hypothetical protein
MNKILDLFAIGLEVAVFQFITRFQTNRSSR